MRKSLNENKKRIIVISAVSILLALIVSVTVTIWRYNFLGSANAITTDEISIRYLESEDTINLTNSLPVSDKDGKAQSDTFDFEVKTRAKRDMDISYDVILEKLEVDNGYTMLNDEDVKLYLTDYETDSELMLSKISDIATNDYVIYSDTNSHSSSNVEIRDKYKLRVWIDKDVSINNWNENTKLQYKFKINVRAAESISNGASTLIKKTGTGGLEKIVHPADSTLQLGATKDITDYRYRGVSPDNYVYFNCTDMTNQTNSTCELWRIIGMFPVEDENGNIENRIKITKDDSLGEEGFKFSDSSNNWETSLINVYLNGDYYNNVLNEAARNMIGQSKYYLGGFYPEHYNEQDITKESVYAFERKNIDSEELASVDNYFYTGNPFNYIGKIAVIYLSDYLYASDDTCNQPFSNYTDESCKGTNWLFKRLIYSWDGQWTVMPNPVLRTGVGAIFYNNGPIVNGGAGNSLRLHPTLYLNSDVLISGGTGESTSPYELSN